MSRTTASTQPTVSTSTLLRTEREVADTLRVSTRTVFNLRRSGRLRFIRIGRSIRIEQSAIDEFVASRREEAL